MPKRMAPGTIRIFVFALVTVGLLTSGRQVRAQITRPTYTPPTVTIPSYTPPAMTPPSVTRPTYTPPTVTLPTRTPPTLSPPIYTPPTVTLPTYTPPTMTPPAMTPASTSTDIPRSQTSDSVPGAASWSPAAFAAASFFKKGTYNRLARFDQAATSPIATELRKQGIGVTEVRSSEGYFEFEVYAGQTPLAVGATYHSPNVIARVGYYVHPGVPASWASDFVRWLLVNGWPAERSREQ